MSSPRGSLSAPGVLHMGCGAGDRPSLPSNEYTAHPTCPSKERIPRVGPRASGLVDLSPRWPQKMLAK